MGGGSKTDLSQSIRRAENLAGEHDEGELRKSERLREVLRVREEISSP